MARYSDLQARDRDQHACTTVARPLLVALAIGLVTLTGCGVAAHGRNAEGVRLYQQGQYQLALQKFQEALYGDPANSDAHYNLAATYHRLGKLQNNAEELQQAESYYNQAIDHNPNHPDAYRGLAVLLTDQNRRDDAFRLMQGWVDRNPTAANPKIELARLYQETGDRTAAKERLLEALTNDPYNARALSALGKVHEELGNTDQALADYQRSLWNDRFQPEVAARVAALQATTSPRMVAAPNDGTRTVNAQPAVNR